MPEGAVTHTLFFFTFFGAPIAYAIAGLAGLPTLRWLERTGWLGFWPLMVLGSSAGAAALVITWWGFWGSPALAPPIIIIGAAAGALAAGVFWMIDAHDCP